MFIKMLMSLALAIIIQPFSFPSINLYFLSLVKKITFIFQGLMGIDDLAIHPVDGLENDVLPM